MKKFKRFFKKLRASMTQLLFLLVLILAVGGASLLWGFKAMDVTAVSIDGNLVLTEAELEASFRNKLNEPFFGPFFTGNLITFPKKRIRENLMEQFPRIAQVEFKKDLFEKTIALTIAERQTAGIYCSAHEDTPEPTQELSATLEIGTFPDIIVDVCFLMDAEGIIFAVAPETEGSLIMTILDADGGEVFEGAPAINADTLSEILTVWSAFKERVPVPARRILRRPNGVLTVETFEGWEAVFTLDNPMEAQTVALTELIAKELEPKERTGISVIDLRVPGRIYYR